MIKINLALEPEARKVFAKATGSLDLQDAPELAELQRSGFIPQKGDCLRWDSISRDTIFVVESRLVRLGAGGGVEIDLFIDCDPQP